MYIMSSKWSIMNNKSQIYMCKHPGLAPSNLPCCNHEIAWVSFLTGPDSHAESYRIHLSIQQWLFWNHSTIQLVPEESQLGVRNTTRTSELCSSAPTP